MAGIAVKFGNFFKDATILQSILGGIQDDEDIYGAGICFVENRKPILQKTIDWSTRIDQERFVGIPITTYQTIKAVLRRYPDVSYRSELILSHSRKPTIGEITTRNIQPLLSYNKGTRLLMAFSGTITNYQELYRKAENDSHAIFTYIQDENFSFLKKIQGSANIVFTYISKKSEPILHVYSSNMNPLYHVFYHDIHFISSDRDSLSLFKRLEDKITITEVPQGVLLKYIKHRRDPIR